MKYRFYIAWMNSKIQSADDLIPEYKKGNKNITTWEFDCKNKNMACLLGYREAFFDNWTADDSVSDVQRIRETQKTKKQNKS